MIVLCFVALMSWACQTNGGAVVGLESLRPPVLLPLRGQFQMPPSDVQWKREGQLLARFHRGRCDHGCNEILQLFSNGSLWLSHGGKQEEGRYSVTVYNESGHLIHQVDITLRVIEIPPEQVLGPGDTSVLLHLNLEFPPVQVNWRKDEQPLGEVYRDICVNGCNEKYNIFPNGSFLLRRVQREDEGRYSAEVYNANNHLTHQTEILIFIYTNQTETSEPLPKSRLPNPVIILIIEGVIFILVIVVSSTCLRKFLYKRRKRNLGHKVNIDLPLSTWTTQLQGQDATTELEGLDGAQSRIYESMEELTTFTPAHRR